MKKRSWEDLSEKEQAAEKERLKGILEEMSDISQRLAFGMKLMKFKIASGEYRNVNPKRNHPKA